MRKWRLSVQWLVASSIILFLRHGLIYITTKTDVGVCICFYRFIMCHHSSHFKHISLHRMHRTWTRPLSVLFQSSARPLDMPLTRKLSSCANPTRISYVRESATAREPPSLAEDHLCHISLVVIQGAEDLLKLGPSVNSDRKDGTRDLTRPWIVVQESISYCWWCSVNILVSPNTHN